MTVQIGTQPILFVRIKLAEFSGCGLRKHRARRQHRQRLSGQRLSGQRLSGQRLSGQGLAHNSATHLNPRRVYRAGCADRLSRYGSGICCCTDVGNARRRGAWIALANVEPG